MRHERPTVSSWAVACVAAMCLAAAPAAQTESPPPFESWLSNLIDEATSRGFERDLVTKALGGVRPLPRVIQADRAQAGPSPGLDAYLSQRLSPALVRQGREKMREHRALLGRIERWFGVQRRFLVAIWGAETSYGPYTGDVPVFAALATLAWEPRRADYFRAELFDALRIVQRGDIELSAMRGSWAGAMGQPQFLPSSYLKYAYDFDGDGRRDIWGSESDTLASIANYLRSFGWRNGETWGREVSLTAGVRSLVKDQLTGRSEGCSATRALTARRPLHQWAADGVRLEDGSPLPRAVLPASLLLTADTRSFLVYRNYEAILAYNCSHYYALGVAMLADELR